MSGIDVFWVELPIVVMLWFFMIISGYFVGALVYEILKDNWKRDGK